MIEKKKKVNILKIQKHVKRFMDTRQLMVSWNKWLHFKRIFLTFCTCIISTTSEKASLSRYAKMTYKVIDGSSQERKLCYLFSKGKIQKEDRRSGEQQQEDKFKNAKPFQAGCHLNCPCEQELNRTQLKNMRFVEFLTFPTKAE